MHTLTNKAGLVLANGWNSKIIKVALALAALTALAVGGVAAEPIVWMG